VAAAAEQGEHTSGIAAPRVVTLSRGRYNPRSGLVGIRHLWLVAPAGDRITLSRIGIGHDTHRLAPGGPLRLGGVDIPSEQHLEGHSDADVLLHSITDALLGAAALEDIGELFPNTDPANRGRDSAEILTFAVKKVAEAGYRVVNVDSVVFAERPKLSPFKPAIRQRLADLLQIDVAQVGLKAKTGEQVGPVGRQEAIIAETVVLLTTC